VQAETLWTLLAPERFPAGEFREAWREVLLFHEHTWGAWDSVSDPDRAGVVEQWEFKRALAMEGDRLSRSLLSALFEGRTQASGSERQAVDVWNTLSWPRGGVVSIPRELSGVGDRVTDGQGRLLPSQRLVSGELAVRIDEVPPLGAARLFVEEGAARASGEARAERSSLANGRILAQLDPRSGTIVRLIQHGSPAIDFAGEGGLNGYLYVDGRDPRRMQPSGPAKASVVDAGPLVAGLRVESAAPGATSLVREYRLLDGSNALAVVNTLDKKRVREKESVHFSFPFEVPDGVLRFDLGEALVVPEAKQLPGACKDFLAVHSSVDVSSPSYGITLTTLDAPLVEIGALTDETQREQQVRSWRTVAAAGTTVYSYAMNNYWHTNYRADQEGEVRFRYALRPHGPESPAAISRASLEGSRPLVVVPADPDVPLPRPPFTVEPAGVLVTSLKPSEDGSAIVARLYNASGAPQHVRLPGKGIDGRPAFLADASGDPVRSIEWPLDLSASSSVLVRLPR
jgi:hypothetical protein